MGVAQLGSAGALGALGRRFKSCRPDSENQFILASFPYSLFYCLLSPIAKGELGGELGSNYKYE